jgi:hypothetical protein
MPDATPRNRRAQRAMSSRDLSRVVALTCKAYSLLIKAYYARAAEKSAAALSAAQELAQEDCFVVTRLRLLRLSALAGYANTPGVAAEAASAAEEQASQALRAAIATLERRRAAGTLLPGTCRTWPEEEWYGEYLQHREALNNEPAHSPVELALLAQFVGYEAYIFAAATASGAMGFKLSSNSSDALPFARFIMRAIDLFEQPRLKLWEGYSLASENALSNTMQEFSEVYGPRIAAHDASLPAFVKELFTRWQRCARGDVLQEREIVAGMAHNERVLSARDEDVAARLATATLRCCSLRSCGARELHPNHYKHCGSCKTIAYCCREHQLEDWPAHKAACKAARKAAAEEAGGAA